MCTRINFVVSLKEEENIVVEKKLCELRDKKGIQFEVYDNCGVRRRPERLPRLHTDDGFHVFGFQSTISFIDGELLSPY